MANAARDENNITGKMAVLNTDTIQGQNLVRIQINNRFVAMNQTDTISFTMKPVDPRDQSYVSCWLFQGTDGLTYPAVANSNGELLVEP